MDRSSLSHSKPGHRLSITLGAVERNLGLLALIVGVTDRIA